MIINYYNQHNINVSYNIIIDAVHLNPLQCAISSFAPPFHGIKKERGNNMHLDIWNASKNVTP